jgi:uncharacterized protein
MLRIFGLSGITTVIALVAAFLYGGTSALVLCAILGVLEVSLSFDNAVVNAGVLAKLDDYWQRLFLTVGVPIATFGMRFTLPMVVVWLTSGLSPAKALTLALHPPAHHAAYFPDGQPSYETYLHHAHPLIAAFGGMFLLMLFLVWSFEDREVSWLSWLERPLASAGRLDMLAVAVSLIALVGVSTSLAATQHLAGDRLATVLLAGILGIVSYIIVAGLGEMFNADEYEAGTAVVKVVGRAALFTFLYLEVLDASMSFDGVIGAFAITADPILIALGLGLIGSMFVRSLTVFLIRDGVLGKYVYLEHGAYWAIGTLSIIMLVSMGVDINDMVTGLVGVVLIGAAFVTSIVRRRREPESEEVREVLHAQTP